MQSYRISHEKLASGISDFTYQSSRENEFISYSESYRIFLNLFRTHYQQYANHIDISDADVVSARKKRFETDDYWKIWKQYGEFVGFVEGFFHKQNGFNMLPRIFEKYPHEIENFLTPQNFMKRFNNNFELVALMEQSGVLRMRNENAENIWNGVKKLIDEFDGTVPRKRWQILLFNGYGRKIANMVMNLVFDLPEIGIDVRVFRAACKLKFIPFKPEHFSSDSIKFEAELLMRQAIPEKFFLEADYLLFMYGGGQNAHTPKKGLKKLQLP